jgi:alpha-beta hydrolase superfamily lysophospholipase
MIFSGCSGKESEEPFEDTGGRQMSDSFPADYSSLDHPDILALLFHPRPGWSAPAEGDGVEVMSIPVEDGVSLGAKLHQAGKSAPVILFFHGNGEIVSDYDDLGPIYVRMGINFFPVDYRGYGWSTGSPTVTGMMRDCHVIFDHVKQRLKQGGYSGPVIAMGRSLGSASALELAAHHEDEIDGLVIESGFANIIPLLRLVGVDIDRLGISEKDDLRNIDKIRGFHKPVLVIHAEYDHIIPFSDGQALFNACSSSDKRFLKIPGADHNTIFAKGIEDYMKEVKRLAEEALKQKAQD